MEEAADFAEDEVVVGVVVIVVAVLLLLLLLEFERSMDVASLASVDVVTLPFELQEGRRFVSLTVISCSFTSTVVLKASPLLPKRAV